MKQSIGMSQQLNIIVVFILIVFALLAATLSYYKAYKISNIIADQIEKYEGYNKLAKDEIDTKLSSIGYQRFNASCKTNNESESNKGYCVYYQIDRENNYYKYKITTYMVIDLPLINAIRLPVTKYTENIYCYGSNCE